MNQENKGRPIEKKITTVVVYKKPTGKKILSINNRRWG
jgi:hypothetical protein